MNNIQFVRNLTDMVEHIVRTELGTPEDMDSGEIRVGLADILSDIENTARDLLHIAQTTRSNGQIRIQRRERNDARPWHQITRLPARTTEMNEAIAIAKYMLNEGATEIRLSLDDAPEVGSFWTLEEIKRREAGQ